MGAIIDGSEPAVVRNEEVLEQMHVSEDIFDAAARRELAEIERRRSIYLVGQHPADLRGRLAIVVDDGVATGATLKAALRGLERKRPASIVVAVPVAPTDIIKELKREVNDVVCLEPLGVNGAVGAHYLRFEQLSDDDVLTLMKVASKSRRQAQGATVDTDK
jgi:predicted phosphoribosyltransferase